MGGEKKKKGFQWKTELRLVSYAKDTSGCLEGEAVDVCLASLIKVASVGDAAHDVREGDAEAPRVLDAPPPRGLLAQPIPSSPDHLHKHI